MAVFNENIIPSVILLGELLDSDVSTTLAMSGSNVVDVEGRCDMPSCSDLGDSIPGQTGFVRQFFSALSHKSVE